MVSLRLKAAVAGVLLVVAVAASGKGAPAGVADATYLDIMEAAVSAYSDEHVASYLAEAETLGVQEHGFPRLAANCGTLIANGRCLARRAVTKRLLDVACRDAGKAMPPKSGGNDFSVKELVLAVEALEKAHAYPKDVTDGWRAALTAIRAEDAYRLGRLKLGDNRARNWVVFACASEQARLAAGMGGDPAFVERYVADQLRWFDENGMYKDPNQPIVYDLVTRLQFAFILAKGYAGPSRGRLLEQFEKSAEITLSMLSASGEIPYGGRSNQFLHNHTFYAALCEWYAAHDAAKGNAVRAARFRLAAKRAIDALGRWLAVRPLRHVKNFYASDSGLGCERYAYFDKYMVTMGSWALMARALMNPRAADPAAVPVASAVRPPAELRLSPAFHQILLAAGDYTAQVTYDADTHYDANGVGRLQRRGAPPTICLSTPCTTEPAYRIASVTNSAPLALGPRAEAQLTAEGLLLTRSCAGEATIDLPALTFDGETHTEIRRNEQSLEVRYGGWVCRYETEGRIRGTGRTAENRNGTYACFQAVGDGYVRVAVTIEPERGEQLKRKGNGK